MIWVFVLVLIVHKWLDRVGWMCRLLSHLVRYGCFGTNMLLVCSFEEGAWVSPGVHWQKS